MCKQDWLRRFVELNEMKKSLDEELKELRDKITKDLEVKLTESTENKVELVKEGFIVSYQTIESNRFDSISFKKDYNDLYEKYTKSSISKRLDVKVKKEILSNHGR